MLNVRRRHEPPARGGRGLGARLEWLPGGLSQQLGAVAAVVLLASAAGWLALRAFVPWLITAAPDSRVARAIIVAFAGGRTVPAPERLASFEGWLSLALVSAVVVSLGLAAAALAVRLGLHRRSSRAANLALLGVGTVALAARDTSLFTDPRFWAEEGTVYFQAALDRPPLDALLAPHQGYFDIVANVGGLLATIPPLEYAPLVTTLIAFAVQLALVAAILLSNAPFLRNSLGKAVGVLAVIIVGTNSGEIWLTTTNSHYYFPVLAFLVLCQDKSSGRGRWVRAVAAGFSGLASVTACFLLPLFLVRYLQRRQREDLVLFGVLGLATLAQLAAIDASYTHFLFAAPAADAAAAPPRFVAAIPIATMLRIMASYGITNPIVADYAAPASLAVAAGTLVVMLYAASRRLGATWHFVAALWILIVLSVAASLGMSGDPRYAYAPAAIFALFLLAIVFDDAAATLVRRLSVGLICLATAVWIASYRTGLQSVRDPSWPSWAAQVRAWRADPSLTALQIHPDWGFQRDAGIVWLVHIDHAPPS